MQGKADDQHGREADRSGAGRDTDGQALREVVHADGRSDREPGPQGATLGRFELDRDGVRPGDGVGVHPGDGGDPGSARDWRLPGAHGTQAALDRSQAGTAGAEPGREQDHQPYHVGERLVVMLEGIEGNVDDGQAVGEHVDEDEGQDADREHGQRHPGTAAEQLHPPHGESEKDGEAGEGSEGYGLSEGHD